MIWVISKITIRQGERRARPGDDDPGATGQGNARRDAALAAQVTFADATMALTTAGTARTASGVTLVGLMHTLIRNLEGKLTKMDPRWLAFGLNMPGANTTPGQPQNVTASIDTHGALILQCDPPALATRFRWRTKLVGAQTEYQLSARSVAPMAMITNLMPGDRVSIIVQAVNGDSQGVASDPIEFTMPLATPATAAPASVVTEEEASLSTSGNRTATATAIALPQPLPNNP